MYSRVTVECLFEYSDLSVCVCVWKRAGARVHVYCTDRGNWRSAVVGGAGRRVRIGFEEVEAQTGEVQ